ncbi:transmembrane regulator, partial [Bordetella bronchiseptica]
MKGGPADPIADVELDAYIDGQLDSARRADVEAFLARDARAAARVSADLRLRDALRQGATRHGAGARDAH